MDTRRAFSLPKFRRHYIGHIHAPGDQERLAADHSVVDLARLLVLRVGGINQLAAKLTLECTDRLFLHIDLQGEGETSVFKNYFAVAGVRKAFCGEGNQRSAASTALLCSDFRRSVARLSERREPVWRAAVMARR